MSRDEMRIQVDERFGEDVDRYQLRYTCADCLLHVEGRGCAHFWPDEDHRVPPPRDPAAGGEIVFCKEFELR